MCSENCWLGVKLLKMNGHFPLSSLYLQIPLMLELPECLTTTVGHSVKRTVQRWLLNWLDTHWNNTFIHWQCVFNFFRESLLCPYSECHLIQLLIKRPLQFDKKDRNKKNKTKQERPRVGSKDFCVYNHHSSVFFTSTSITNHRKTS